MNKRNPSIILISAVGGDIGQGVIRSLKLSGKKIRTIGTDTSAEAAGLYLCDRAYVVPKATDTKAFLRKIIDVCKKERVHLAFICNESEQWAIASVVEELQKSVKTIFIVQPLSVLQLTMDKLATYTFLSERGFRVPKTASTLLEAKSLIKEHGFPLVIKSRRGSGGKHLHIVRNEKEFSASWKSVPDPLLQEYIANAREEEYTVGVFLDNDSRSCGSVAMLRKMRFGLTWTAIADVFPDVSAFAVNVAEAVKAVGPCNVQMRRDKRGELCLLEINARISSTASLRAMLGFNEARASIEYFLERKKPSFNVKDGFVMRTWGEAAVPRGFHARLSKNKVLKK